MVRPEQRRVHRVAAQRGDVRVAAMAGQHRQHHGAKQVALLRGVIAGEKLRAVRHSAVEQAALLQEVDEKWQLAEWRDRGGRIPFDVDSAGEGLRYR
ncbi:MAG: hypothetical protein ABSC06_37785 [Rhodopila sp.]